ncbi:hypothetical protein HPB50_024901 [Hyalomma asiaticum]|uniref:Uncharacterized protein n=1 Tax=Hyalomma asiaticum TaxID=266040 RepID=A0ACB7T4S7_HYAAI|nr:hypothetical protein HPB50_024901 [Hyalomma asiaticum]
MGDAFTVALDSYLIRVPSPTNIRYTLSDITGEFLDQYVSLTDSPSADLLFRSAGDQRFSDFKVLQCNYAYFHVEALKWPDVGCLSWMRAMIHFQLLWPYIQAVKEKHNKMASRVGHRSDPERVIRQHKFLRHVHATRLLDMERLANLGKDVVCH